MGDLMRKLLYICLSILIAINLVACNEKADNTITQKVNESSTPNNTQVSSSENDKNNKDISIDTNNSVRENPITAENNKETKINPSTSQSSKTSGSSTNLTAQSNKMSTNTTSSTSQSNKTGTTTNANLTQQQTVQPKNKKVIVIDPGHANRSNLEKEPLAPGSSVMKIKDGGGAQGVATGTPEYRVNMNVAVKLKTILQNKGYTVVMTKTQDSQSLGNVERANIGNNANAALVIRIHADSSTNTSAKGASMLVPAPINNGTKVIYSASKSYGRTVLNTLVQEVGMVNRGVTEHSDMTGFNWSKVPVILVEMGFLSNSIEDRLLSSQAYEDKIAKALADGIAIAIK